MSYSHFTLGSPDSGIPLTSGAVNQVEEGLQRVVVTLVLLCFSGFVCEAAIAEERTEAHDLASATNPMALTVQEEIVKAAKPGSNFKECAKGCPVMIVVPAGQFSMGSPDNESDRQISENPQHQVTVATSFAVSKFEVTFADWDVCVAAGACRQVDDIWGRGEMPVVNVSWADAKQYTRWYRSCLEGSTAFRRRRNGNTPRGRAPQHRISGALTLVLVVLIVMAAITIGCNRRPALDLSSQTDLAFTTCTGTCGNGSRMYGTIITRALRLTDRHGLQAGTPGTGLFAAVPGTMMTP